MKNQLENIASLILLGEINIAEDYFCNLKVTQNVAEIKKDDEDLFISLQLFLIKTKKQEGRLITSRIF